MPSDQAPLQPPASEASKTEANQKRRLPGAAERALAEAAARRAECGGNTANQPKEVDGRNGPEATRYGDWEVNGLASDF